VYRALFSSKSTLNEGVGERSELVFYRRALCTIFPRRRRRALCTTELLSHTFERPLPAHGCTSWHALYPERAPLLQGELRGYGRAVGPQLVEARDDDDGHGYHQRLPEREKELQFVGLLIHRRRLLQQGNV